MIKKNILYICLLILISNCGFSVIDRSSLSDFNIIEISTIGEKKVNYKIKNKLLSYSQKNDKRTIKVDLASTKEKTIKEKNIKNEVTKYEVDISVKVKFYEIGKIGQTKEFTVRRDGEYNVNSQHSQTLNNEKKLIDIMVDYLADQIFNELTLRVNDL